MSTNQSEIGDFAAARKKREEMLAAQAAEVPEIGDFTDARMMRNQNVGLGSYLMNMTQGLYAIYKTSKGQANDETSQKVFAALNNVDPSLDYVKMAVQDWAGAVGKFGDILSNPIAAQAEFSRGLPANIESIKESIAGFSQAAGEGGLIALGGMLAKAMVEPIGDLFESSLGVQLADGSFRALTDDEKEYKLKNAVGFGVSLAFGGALARGPLAISTKVENIALSRTFAALKRGDRSTEVNLLGMINRAKLGSTGATIPKGKLAREVIAKGTVVGAATGAAYSGILYANEDDVLAQMFLEGVVFAPLGVAFETLGLRGANKMYADNARIADNIANLRQVQNVRDNTIAGVVSHIDAMMRGDELAEALLTEFQTNPLIIARITPEQVASVQDKIGRGRKITTNAVGDVYAPSNLVIVSGVDKNGVHRAIVTTKMIADAIDKPFFARTGLIKEQYISHNGKDYIVIGDERVTKEGHVTVKEVNTVRMLKGSEADLTLLDSDIQILEEDLSDAWRHYNDLLEAADNEELSTQIRAYNTIEAERFKVEELNKVETELNEKLEKRASMGLSLYDIRQGIHRAHQDIPTYSQGIEERKGELEYYENRKKNSSVEEAEKIDVHIKKTKDIIETLEFEKQEAINKIVELQEHPTFKLNKLETAVAFLPEQIREAEAKLKWFTRYGDATPEGQPNAFRKEIDDAQAKVDEYRNQLVEAQHELNQFDPGVTEVPLSELRAIARPEGAYPIERVYHGTGFVFDEFDPAISSEGNLKGPGAGYFTEMSSIASHYVRKGLRDADGDTLLEVHDIEQQIRLNTERIANANEYIAEFTETLNNKDSTKAARDVAETNIGYYKQVLEASTMSNVGSRADLERVLEKTKKVAGHVRVHSLDIRNPFDTDNNVPALEIHRIFHGLDVNTATPFVPDGPMTGDEVRWKLKNDYFDGDERRVNQHLESLGYDAITHIGGRNMGDTDHRVWVPFRSDQIKTSTWGPEHPAVRLGPARGVSIKGEFNPQSSLTEQMNRMYRNFRRNMFSNQSINDFTPEGGWSFERIVKEFGESIGLTQQELPMFRSEMRKRMAEELEAELFGLKELKERINKNKNNQFYAHDLEEARVKVIQKNINMREAAEKVALREQLFRHDKDSHTLVSMANNNNMLIDVEDAGRIVIRDIDSGNELGRFSRFDDAQEFIDRTGQADGAKLDFDGGDLPPVAPHLFSAPNYSNEPFSMFRQGRMSRAVDVLNIAMPWITRNRELFTSFDNRFKTKLFARVFDTLNDAAIKRNAAIRPYYEKLRKIDDIVSGMTKAEREKIGEFLETMSPEEVVDRYLGSRKLSDFEKAAAEVIIDSDADIKKIYEYRRMLKDWDKDANAGKIRAESPEQLAEMRQQKVDELKAALYLTDGDLTGIKLFDEVEGMNKDFASLGTITRLARAIRGADGKPELSRMEFAAKHKLTKQQIKAAHELEKMWKELAKEFNIDEKQQLNGYMTHARLYTGDDVGLSMHHFPTDKTKAFYARLSRTGEIAAWEKDPVVAMQRYIKAGFDERLISKVRTQAESAMVEEIENAIKDKRIVSTKAARQIREISERYISDVTGHADAGGRLLQEVVDNFFDSVGAKDLSPDIRRQVVNVISSTGEAAAQGLRLTAAIRDFMSGYIVSTMRYGWDETHNIIKLGLKGLDDMTPAEIAAVGDVPRSGLVNFSDPVEHSGSLIRSARGKFTRKLDRFNQFAFDMSGQKNVYQMWHVGHFAATVTRTAPALIDFRNKKISLHEFAKKISLQKYDVPIIDEFMRLIDEGKNDQEAVKFLARQTGQDMVGVYGFANHPSGWNTDVGRVAGQFGQWSMWFRQSFMREATRGSLTDRAGAMFRLAATQKLMVGAGAAVGLNLTRWQPTDGLFFGGGPVVDFAVSLMKATTGSGYAQAEGQRRLARYVPFVGDTYNVGQIYLPGSFFAQDLLKAFELFEQGDSRAFPRALGIPVETEFNQVKTFGGVPFGGMAPSMLEQAGFEQDGR